MIFGYFFRFFVCLFSVVVDSSKWNVFIMNPNEFKNWCWKCWDLSWFWNSQNFPFFFRYSRSRRFQFRSRLFLTFSILYYYFSSNHVRNIFQPTNDKNKTLNGIWMTERGRKTLDLNKIEWERESIKKYTKNIERKHEKEEERRWCQKMDEQKNFRLKC